MTLNLKSKLKNATQSSVSYLELGCGYKSEHMKSHQGIQLWALHSTDMSYLNKKINDA